MTRLSRFRAPATLLGAAVLLFAACGGGGAPPAPPARAVTVQATEFAFTPASLEASAGETVKVTLENKGTVEHDFVIDELRVKAHAAVGTSADATLSDLKPGTYTFYCTIAGHRQAGMEGTLVVK